MTDKKRWPALPPNCCGYTDADGFCCTPPIGWNSFPDEPDTSEAVEIVKKNGAAQSEASSASGPY